MPHVIEHAASGRSKCRGCNQKIEKDELRFGEARPNAFGDGEMTLWFHVPCAAYKRPEPFLELLDGVEPEGSARDELAVAQGLRPAAEFGIEHRRVPRIDTADRAPTGRARCRSCRELIEKDSWRIGLVFFEEYRFQPGGYIHAGCAGAYFGSTDLRDRIAYFNHELAKDQLEEMMQAVRSAPGSP